MSMTDPIGDMLTRIRNDNLPKLNRKKKNLKLKKQK